MLVTDKLKSYAAAKREIMPGVEHRQHKGLNNRAENPTRRFAPGEAVLFEDLTGQGHTSRSVGGDRLTAIVPLAD